MLLFQGSIVALKNIQRRSIQLAGETLRDLNAVSRTDLSFLIINRSFY